MVADAEQHRDEDQRLRELTDARNELDAAAYQVEKTCWPSAATRCPCTRRHGPRGLVADARQALKEDAPIERITDLIAELQARSTRSSARRRSGRNQPGERAALPSDDDVIDAEFTSDE